MALTSTSSVATADTSNVIILALNLTRRGAHFLNNSSADLYLKFGSVATSSSFTVKVPAGGYYELPFPVYTGRIDGIWTAVNGNLQVTEITT